LVGEEGKIVQILRRMVWLLHTSGEYDLHLEPIWEGGQEVALLRMRAGEEWREVRQIPRALHEELVLKCKQQAGLSIEERSRPQAGSASLVYGDTLVPMRVSVSPTLNGERVAIRVVPTCSRSLADLGLADSPLAKWLDQSQGLVLITGPTGSGKVTTQAACVRQLAERKLSIVSAEDPLEYLFPRGVAHLKLEQFTRAEGLRALLQQAPDVIVLGELETDPELARSAAVAADKGHLVLAYQHGHDSISALYDFLEWGVERSVLTATLVGIVNQHLLARLCDACKAKHVPENDLLREIRTCAEEGGYRIPDSAVFYEPVGCESCHGKGYLDRCVTHEYFTFSPVLETAFLRGASQDELTRLAREEGRASSFAVGVQKAVEGITWLEQVMRRMPHWRT
jgi:type IV pilus assembly protein PilB